MAITNTIHGNFVDLRCADIDDAEFTLQIRNDPKLTQFIPKISNTVENQKLWLSKQRQKDGDYFFIICDKYAKPLGTISCYDINFSDSTCEAGRYLSYGDPVQNIESMILLYDFIFNFLNLKTVIMEVDIRNKKVINIHKKFGVVYQETLEMNGWTGKKFDLYREVYKQRRPEIVALFEKLL